MDARDKRPLYIQLVEALLAQIAEDYAPNDQLPTEKELCDEYAMSRTTVRQALAELEHRGRIYRVQGKGSFVAPIQADSFNPLFDADFCLHCGDLDPDDVTREFVGTSGSVSLSTLQLFGMQRREGVVRVDALYRVGGVPVASDTVYLRAGKVSSGHVDSIEALSGALLSLREEIASVCERYSARPCLEKEAAVFGSVDGTVLAVTRLARGENGELLVLTERRVLTDRVAYQNVAFSA